MNPVNTECAQSVRLSRMAKQESIANWDLIHYLFSIGMTREETAAWLKAREDARSFRTNESDRLGAVLDQVWRGNSQIFDPSRKQERLGLTEPVQRIQSMGDLRQGYLRSRVAWWRMIAAILWFYSFMIWMYVIAFQIAQPESVYWSLAVWLPRWVRLDYLGETGFFASFAFALIWAKLSLLVKP